MSEFEFDFATLAVRHGYQRTGEQEHSEAIFPTSSFMYASAAEAAARFSGELPGNIYSRFTNPTVRAFEQRLAALEGAERCVATASGMAAIQSTFSALLKAGDHLLCSRSVFGSVPILLNKYFVKFGIEVEYVELTDLADWERKHRPNTRLVFIESPSNPLGEVVDIRALAQITQAKGSLLVVDNCFCTPALQQPLSLGADLVVHSATKYIDGQGRCLGGAVLGSAALVEEVYGYIRSAGPTLSPFNAWVLLKGLETLELRMRAHSAAALSLATWLQQQPQISRVFYPGLSSPELKTIIDSQQKAYGGVLAIELIGGKDAAWQFIDRLRIFSITANLGDVKSTVTHPATTTHGRLSPEDRATAGIRDGLVRLSIGLESVDDLRRDLQQALAG